jgi:hypothetical protein
MCGRRTAPLAELLQLEAVPRVGLALRGDVIAPLAVLACEGDRRSLVTGHDYSLRFAALSFWLLAKETL